MRILVIDHYGGDGMLDYVLRCQDAEHEVKWHFKKTDKTVEFGKGLATIVDDWRPWMRWADLVVLADNTHYLREIDSWRREGIKVVGASVEAAKWEIERKTGMEVFKKAGIEVPKYREFNDYDTAIAYVKREGRAFVSKPCYDETDKNLSYVAKTPADLVYMLQRWKKSSKLKGSFILQEKVVGTEIAVGGWFGPGGFNQGWCVNFEEKKLFAGGLGMATGEMGTVVQYVKKSKLADKMLKPLIPHLEKLDYCGYVDVNCIVDEKGAAWPLEFTMRNGYPTWNIQQELHAGCPAEWLLALAEGTDLKCFDYGKVAVGVVVALPDFPVSRLTHKDVVGVPIYGLDDAGDGVHLAQAMAGTAPHDVDGKVVDTPCVVTAGDYVLIACGKGDSITAARRGAYRTIDKLSLPNSPFWRIDIGKRLAKQLPLLQKHGYATDLVY